MLLRELELEIPRAPLGGDPLGHFAAHVDAAISPSARPVRFAVTASTSSAYHCELGLLEGAEPGPRRPLFEFRKRAGAIHDAFNAVLVIPTGIGAEIGGHAGDATPVTQLLGQLCDTLITHPNVVNASDINEMPANCLYVEGSVVARLLQGTVSLSRTRANRVLLVIDAHRDSFFVHAAANAVNAARSAYGLDCAHIIQLDPPLVMRARYATSGRAVGRVAGVDRLFQLLEAHRDEFDAVALSSVIDVPGEYHTSYFESGGEMVNPWGGVEAMLTHAVSTRFGVPSAHSPMFENQAIANVDPGIVDPRMAAEAVSLTFLQCILKGLRQSPQINEGPGSDLRGQLSAEDVSCLVIPDGCIGLPTLAALSQGIPVIAVRENKNVMRNDLRELPWAPGQLIRVENYWEAAGVMAALKAGIVPGSVRRPIRKARLSLWTQESGVSDARPSAKSPASEAD